MITYPRALPFTRFSSIEFEPETQSITNATDGGEITSTQIAPTRWRARYETETIDDAAAGIWRAWLASLRGTGRTFYGFDPRFIYPLAYRKSTFLGLTRHGGGSFDGTASSFSINVNRDVITLNGLPTSFVLAPGDYVGLSWSTSKRSLHRVIEGGTAAAGVLAVTVEPIIDPRIVPASGVTASLYMPNCVMVATSIETPRTDWRWTRFVFEATQRLEA